jgi:hypothetical protein
MRRQNSGTSESTRARDLQFIATIAFGTAIYAPYLLKHCDDEAASRSLVQALEENLAELGIIIEIPDPLGPAVPLHRFRALERQIRDQIEHRFDARASALFSFCTRVFILGLRSEGPEPPMALVAKGHHDLIELAEEAALNLIEASQHLSAIEMARTKSDLEKCTDSFYKLGSGVDEKVRHLFRTGGVHHATA